MTTLPKTLKRKQRQHVALLAKVEKAAGRLDRRKLKLSALESTIAELEGRVAGPRKRSGTRGESVQGIRRAQLIFNPTS